MTIATEKKRAGLEGVSNYVRPSVPREVLRTDSTRSREIGGIPRHSEVIWLARSCLEDVVGLPIP